MKLPNKFEFIVSYDVETKYRMARVGDYYFCTYANEDINSREPRRWGANTVKNNVIEGSWIITNDLDEPELVLPFTYIHKDDDDVYMVEQGFSTDKVNITSPTGRHVRDWWTKGQCREFIKSGTWIVQSVGEQKPLEAPTSDDKAEIVPDIEERYKDALCVIKELTEALTRLADAYERVIYPKEMFENV